MTEQLGEIMREVVKLGTLAEINEAAFLASITSPLQQESRPV